MRRNPVVTFLTYYYIPTDLECFITTAYPLEVGYDRLKKRYS